MPLINAIIAADIFGFVITLIVLYGVLFESRSRYSKKSTFALMTVTVALSLVCDALSWVLDGQIDYLWLLHIVTSFTFISAFISTGLFPRYLYLHISARHRVKPGTFYTSALFSFAAMVLTVIGCAAGVLYRLPDALYEAGPLYLLYLGLLAVVFVVQLFLTFSYRHLLSFHDMAAVVLYMMMPSVGIALNLIWPDYSFTYPISALMLLMMYVMLQSEQETEQRRQVEVVTTQAHQDELTGLFNRRAYTERCDHLSDTGEIGVIFCDANGLKYANDRFGHEAGDQLLCSLAHILTSRFSHNQCFRISGDEFVVLLPAIEQHSFEDRVAELRRCMAAQEVPAAAVGCAHGSQASIRDLIAQAEQDMYAEKARFYECYPAYKRT